MAKTNEIVVAEDTQPQPPKAQPPQPHLPNLFALFPKLNLQLPFLNPPKPKPKHGDSPNNVADDQAKGKGKEELLETCIRGVTQNPAMGNSAPLHTFTKVN